METPTLFIALAAGLLSFLSPCVLPLVPAYIGYLGGSAVTGARAAAMAGDRGGTVAVSTASARWIVFTHALLFVIGFTLIFAILGGLVGSLNVVLARNIQWLQVVMGIVLVVFGLHMMGVFNISFLNYTRRLELRPSQNLGYLRSFLIGLGFGIGWTPCIGPTLGLIFTMAIRGNQAQALPLFLAYAIGLGIPFLLAALAMGQISTFLKKITRRTYTLKVGRWTIIDQANMVSLISGALLIFMGVLITFDWLTLLAPSVNWFNV